MKEILKGVLVLNLLFCTIYFLIIKKNIKIIQNKNLFVKTRVLVDSIKNSVSDTGHGTEVVYIYYSKPKGRLVLENSKSIFQNHKRSTFYQSFFDYYNSHNDSINIWHSSKLGDLYAYEDEVSVLNRVQWGEFYFSIISFCIGALTIVFWKGIFTFLK